MEFGGVLPAVLVILAMLAKALQTVSCQYLVEAGESWYQVTMFGELTYLALILLYWIITYSYQYYRYNTINTNKNKCNTYIQFLLSIFPSTSDCKNIKLWILLVLRGIFGCAAFLLQIASLQFVDSGDSTLIQTVSVTVGNAFCGILFFKEEKSVVLFMSLVGCIIGLVLVCQPLFIFGLGDSTQNTLNKYNPVSMIGFIIATMAGISRLLCNVITKESKKYDLHWLVLVIMGASLSCIGDVIVFSVAMYGFDGIYWKFDNYDMFYIVVTLSVGFWISLLVAFITIAFQFGNMSKLGILVNSDIIFIYGLQILILKIYPNYLTYIGAFIVLIACIAIFVENMKKSQKKERIGNDLDDSKSKSNSHSKTDSGVDRENSWYCCTKKYGYKGIDSNTLQQTKTMKDQFGDIEINFNGNGDTSNAETQENKMIQLKSS